MKKITKAIIPAAGLGTRMLPISHAVCKEMLPIVDLPAIFYLVEEAAKSGITDILVITNRDKEAIEDFFDLSVEYGQALARSGKTAQAERLYEIANMANVYFLRQKETKGLGHAVGRARKFVGDEPFVVLYGDDVIFSETPVCRQMIDVYEKYGKPVVGVKPVSLEDLRRYSSLKVDPIDGEERVTFCTDMIESPSPARSSPTSLFLAEFSLLPRCSTSLITSHPEQAEKSSSPTLWQTSQETAASTPLSLRVQDLIWAQSSVFSPQTSQEALCTPKPPRSSRSS